MENACVTQIVSSVAAPDNYWQTVGMRNIPSSLQPDPLLLAHLPRSARVLDVGCGAGKTLEWLWANGYRRIIGVDLNAQALRDFRMVIDHNRSMVDPFDPVLIAANALHLPFYAETFDGVLTQAFWTTISDPKLRIPMMGEIARVLRPGGILYLADFGLNEQLPHYRARYEAGQQQGYAWGTFDVVEHGRVLYQAHHYSSEELTTLLDAGYFSIISHTQPFLRTRSGNGIKGHIIIARLRHSLTRKPDYSFLHPCYN